MPKKSQLINCSCFLQACLFLMLCLVGCTDPKSKSTSGNEIIGMGRSKSRINNTPRPHVFEKSVQSEVTNDFAGNNIKSGTAKDLNLQIAIPEVSKIGEPILMEAVLTNNSSGKAICTQRINESGAIWSQISIYNAKENKVGRTTYGKKVVFENHPNNLRRLLFILIEPGNSNAWKEDLNKLFKFTPGKYELLILTGVHQQGLRWFTVTVEKVPFTITK